MKRPDLEPALSLARTALAAAPAGLLTDLDGTLAPIVTDPAAARVVPGSADALARLGGRLAVVGVITGRAAADARLMLGCDEVLVVGNHGLEWLEPGEAEPRPAPELTAAAAALDQVLRVVPAEPGVSVEHKGLSATIHVRGARDPDAAKERARAALEAADLRVLTLRPGRMSLEVRPAGLGDKGTAVRSVVERHRLRGVVVIGDDVTDLDMFRAAASLRAAGTLRAAILAVAGRGEVPAEVLAAADAVLPDPRRVVDMLQRL